MKVLAGDLFLDEVPSQKTDLLVHIGLEPRSGTGLKPVHLMDDQAIDNVGQQKAGADGQAAHGGNLFILEGVLQIPHGCGEPMKHARIPMLLIAGHVRKPQVLEPGANMLEQELIFRVQRALPVDLFNDSDQGFAVHTVFPELPADPVALGELFGRVVEVDRVGQRGIQVDVVVGEHGCKERVALLRGKAGFVQRSVGEGAAAAGCRCRHGVDCRGPIRLSAQRLRPVPPCQCEPEPHPRPGDDPARDHVGRVVHAQRHARHPGGQRQAHGHGVRHPARGACAQQRGQHERHRQVKQGAVQRMATGKAQRGHGVQVRHQLGPWPPDPLLEGGGQAQAAEQHPGKEQGSLPAAQPQQADHRADAHHNSGQGVTQPAQPPPEGESPSRPGQCGGVSALAKPQQQGGIKTGGAIARQGVADGSGGQQQQQGPQRQVPAPAARRLHRLSFQKHTSDGRLGRE